MKLIDLMNDNDLLTLELEYRSKDPRVVELIQMLKYYQMEDDSHIRMMVDYEHEIRRLKGDYGD